LHCLTDGEDGNKETRGVANKCVAMRFFFSQDGVQRCLLTNFLFQKMSLQLTNLVPVLTRPNYQEWAAYMHSYLMSQGQWKCVKKDATPPDERKDGDNSLLDDWNETAECVLGKYPPLLVPHNHISIC
jgi:hypothetical protein